MYSQKFPNFDSKCKKVFLIINKFFDLIMHCYFASDLHGKTGRYEKLFSEIVSGKPEVVLLGGDLLPHSYGEQNFVLDFIKPLLEEIKNKLGNNFPRILLILGNDDAARDEKYIYELHDSGLIQYIHFRKTTVSTTNFYGYSFTPPSPFLLKDWEKYDISRYVDPGSISPEDGKRTIEIPQIQKRFSTIKDDLEKLAGTDDLNNAVFLFHGPPYKTNLDRAALDGKMIDHAPLDPHVGSIAIKKFIETKQPMLTLHGHIHESPGLTGSWKDKIGKTFCFSAAHDGKEFALVKFDLDNLEKAERILI